MTTQRPFTHLILFTLVGSLALLGGCASEGTKGAAGAAGADGTVSVPSADSDLAVTAVDDNDSDYTLGQVSRRFTISGLDNLSATSRTRYYGYLGTGSTTKT